MARLPQPGSDEGTWGDVLNTYLSVSHDTDGTIKTDAVPADAIQDDSVSQVKLATTNSPSNGQVLSYNGTDLVWSNAGSPDPSMGGDLSGTASNAQIVAGAVGATELATDAVTTIKILNSNVTDAKIATGVAQSKITNLVSDLAGKEPAITGGSTAQYWRGDKSFQTLDKTAVGLANVDNTSDANKPVSGATQTALNGKVSVINGGGETYFDAGNSGAAKSLDLTNGNVQKLTLTANCTITLTSPTSGTYRSMLLYVFQDGTGSRTITWPGSVSWGTAGAPTLTTTASKMDKILLDTVDGGTTWYGSAGPGGF